MVQEKHLNFVLDAYHGFLLKYAAHPFAAAYSRSGNFLGYLMRFIDEATPLSIIQNKVLFAKQFKNMKYHRLCDLAITLCINTEAAHRAGYVIGDMNPKNFVVDPLYRVYAVDVDSFQFRSQDTLHRCSGRILDWLHPDLHKKEWVEVELKPEHDYFALAKLIFQVLMFGENPYAAVYNDPTRGVNWIYLSTRYLVRGMNLICASSDEILDEIEENGFFSS